MRLLIVLSSAGLLATSAFVARSAETADAITGYEVVQGKKAVKIEPGASSDVKATCPKGKVPLGGGGYTHTDNASIKLSLVWSGIDIDQTGGQQSWAVGYANHSTSAIDTEIFATVVCAKVPQAQ